MSRRARRVAWTLAGSVVAGFILLTGTVATINAITQDVQTFTEVIREPVAALDIEVSNGAVTVVAVEAEPVAVTARVTGSLHRSEQQTAVEDGRLVVRERCRGWTSSFFCRTDYTISVPPGIDVDIRSRHGSVLVRGIEGTVNASSSNGSVAVEDVTGSLQLRSSNGRVEGRGLRARVATATSSNGPVSLAFARPPSTVRAESSNGPVEVLVPEDRTAYRVDASSSNGPVETLVATDPASRRTIVAHSDNGPVTIRTAGR